MSVESVPNEEKEHGDVIDVHLIEASENQEKHHGVLNVDEKDEEERVKDARSPAADFFDQLILKPLFCSFCVEQYSE